MNVRFEGDFERRLIVHGLPEGWTPADPHLQIFDNYVADTSLRFRKVRDPQNNARLYQLAKLGCPVGEHMRHTHTSLDLTDSDYEHFDFLRGREIRLNRYFENNEVLNLFYDVYLGALEGLIILKAGFDSYAQYKEYSLPSKSALDITNDPFFDGANLVDHNASDIRAHLSK